jgi:hypothetical protein
MRSGPPDTRRFGQRDQGSDQAMATTRCALQLVITELFVATAKRFVDAPARDRHTRRRPVNLVLLLETGVLIGVVAATFDQVWVVVAALVMMLAVNAFAILWAVRLIRRRRRLSPHPD